MKAFRCLLLMLLLIVIGTTLFMYLRYSTTTSNPDAVVSIGSRKLRRKLIIIKGKMEDHGDNNITTGDMNLEDYYNGPGLTDPVPSSSTNSVKPGPIQHGTPLMPYIPKPSPPTPSTARAEQASDQFP